jgi:hypothetical protein
MYGRKNVESDKRNALRAFRDTQGLSDPERTVRWLEKLAKAEFRGRGDTMSAARDRAAEKYGAPISKTKRLWDRWQTMKSVAGDVMIPLMLAYEEMVQRNEAAAQEYRAERHQLREERHATDLERARQGVGEGGSCLGTMAQEEA